MTSQSPLRQCSVPSLAKSTPLKVSYEKSSCSTDWMKQLHDYLLPVLLAVAVIVAGVLAWIANDHTSYVTGLGWPSLLCRGPLMGVVLTVALLLAAFATAHGHHGAEKMGRMVLLGLFVLVAVLMIVAFWFFYRRRDSSTAFYLILAAFIVALVHAYFAWRHGGVVALVAMVPLLVILAVAAWLLARANWSCGTNTTTVTI